MKILLILTALMTATHSAKADIFAGVSASYLNINNPSLEYIKESDKISGFNSITVGNSESYKDVVFTIATNRLLNQPLKSDMILNNAYFVKRESRVVYDSFQVGYKLGSLNPRLKNLIPSFLVANTMSNQKIWFNGKMTEQTNWAYVYGLNLNIFVDEKRFFSMTYILPNKELYLEGGLTVGFNFLF